MKPAVKQIARQVMPFFGLQQLEPEEMLGRDCYKSFAEARQVCMWACRKALRMSFPEIGRAFLRDHSTVMSAVRAVDRKRVRDPGGLVAAASAAVFVGVSDGLPVPCVETSGAREVGGVVMPGLAKIELDTSDQLIGTGDL